MAEGLRNNLFEDDIFNHISQNVFGGEASEYNREILSTKLRGINLHPYIREYEDIIENEDHYGFNRILQKIIPILQQHIFAQVNKPINVKDELKKEMGIQSKRSVRENFANKTQTDVVVDKVFDISSVKELGMKINPKGNFKETTVFLDTRYRNFSVTNNTTNFSWQLYDNFTSEPGGVGYYGEIRKIHGLRIGDFYIPIVNAEMTYYGNITTFVSEFATQSIPGTENRRYHFFHDGLTNTVDTRRFDLTSKEKKTTNTSYMFETPINTPNSITFTFGSPMVDIVFNQDRFVLTTDFTINGGGNILFNVSDTSLVTGDIIYIDNYEESTNTTFQNTVNRNSGHAVTAVVAGTEYSIAAGNFLAMTGTSFTIHRGDRRFFVQLTFLHE